MIRIPVRNINLILVSMIKFFFAKLDSKILEHLGSFLFKQDIARFLEINISLVSNVYGSCI